MERIDKILANEKFIKSLKKLRAYEKKRKFCGHGFEHSLDVARIAYILDLEKNLGFEKEIIYAAALLHDIGRWRQYKTGEPHDKASAQIASGILKEAGFIKSERILILSAILSHREFMLQDTKSLNYLLYTADKKSRNCFRCGAYEECDWPAEKKNPGVTY